MTKDRIILIAELFKPSRVVHFLRFGHFRLEVPYTLVVFGFGFFIKHR